MMKWIRSATEPWGMVSLWYQQFRFETFLKSFSHFDKLIEKDALMKQWLMTYREAGALFRSWPTSIDPVTQLLFQHDLFRTSAPVCRSEMITSPSRCIRSCLIARVSCVYERAVSNHLNCCSYCQKAIMSAAVATPCDPSEVLSTPNMLPQRHGNDATNGTFHWIVGTLWPEMPWKTCILRRMRACGPA